MASNNDPKSARSALDAAVIRFCNEEVQSEDIIFATVSSAITTDCLHQLEEVDVSNLRLSSPHISWRVTLQVDGRDSLRVVLRDVSAEDMRCLRVRGDIRIRRRKQDDELLIVSGSSTDDDLAYGSPPAQPGQLGQPHKSIGVVMDGPGTIASVNLSTVSEMRISVSTFYYHPRQQSGEEQEEAEEEGDEEEEGDLLQQLGADFGQLLVSEDAADVILMVDGLPVRAHRSVLVARSEAFRKMFIQDNASQVHVTDVSHDAFLKVLDFMYTASVSGLSGSEMPVLVLANRFGLPDLADTCCRRLLLGIRKENALKILAFAEEHGVDVLKERALLVAVEHLREVTASVEWRMYKQTVPSLAADLLETAAQVLRKPSE